MKHTTKWTLALLAPVLIAATSASELQQFVRDDAHSQINFSASSRMIDAQGYWDKWDTQIAFDPTAIEKTTFNLNIDAKSVNTRIGMRDNHLRSCAFFCADSFPVITFKSKIVKNMTGANADPMLANTKLLITGDITIRGVTKTISLPSTLVFFDREHSIGRVKGQFTLLRKDFGVGFDPPGNPVENEVGVQFDIAFQQLAPPKP